MFGNDPIVRSPLNMGEQKLVFGREQNDNALQQNRFVDGLNLAISDLVVGWVYRPQPKRRKTDLNLNPLWVRYMHQNTSIPATVYKNANCAAPSVAALPVTSPTGTYIFIVCVVTLHCC